MREEPRQGVDGGCQGCHVDQAGRVLEEFHAEDPARGPVENDLLGVVLLGAQVPDQQQVRDVRIQRAGVGPLGDQVGYGHHPELGERPEPHQRVFRGQPAPGEATAGRLVRERGRECVRGHDDMGRGHGSPVVLCREPLRLHGRSNH